MFHYFISVLTILFIIIINSIGSPLSFFTSADEGTTYYLSTCDSCLAINLHHTSTSQGWDSPCSSLPDINGVSAETAIVRSLTVESFIHSKIPYPPVRTVYVYAGSDEDSEGTWKIPSTGEIFYANSQARPFAWIRWATNEPNNMNGQEHMLSYLSQSGHTSELDAWRSNDISAGFMSNGNSARICMYQFDVIDSFKITSSFSQDDLLLFENNELTRCQIFPEHKTQLDAFRHCESISVTDPNTGDAVVGSLAVFYTAQEFELVVQMLKAKSDVRYHSTDNDYGAWIGANSSASNIETFWYQRGTRTEEPIKCLTDSNQIPAQVYFNKGEAASPNAGVSIGLSSSESSKRYKMIWTLHTISSVPATLPFVCQWRFIINATLALSNMLQRDLSTSNIGTWSETKKVQTKVSYFIARAHQIWEKSEDAEDTCWNSKLTNEAGDTVRGHLAMIFKPSEWSAIRKLSKATRLMQSGNGVSNSALYGYLVGASTDGVTSWGGVKSTLKRQLKWNRRIGKISIDGADGVDSTFDYQLDVWNNDLSCAAYNNCPDLDVQDTHNSVHVTYRDDTNELLSFATSRRRGFICTYRFPVRFVASHSLVIEYNGYPMVFSEAQRFCSQRTITSPEGITINGSLGIESSEYQSSSSKYIRDSIESFMSDPGQTDLHGTGPVFVARKVSDSNCLLWRRLAKSYDELPCNSPAEFVCYFRLTSRTKSFTDWTPGRPTISNSTSFSRGTETPSSTQSSSLTESEGTLSLSQNTASPAATESKSDRSPSLSQSKSETENSPSRTESPPQTVSHSQDTKSDSSSLSANSSTSPSATESISRVSPSDTAPSSSITQSSEITHTTSRFPTRSKSASAESPSLSKTHNSPSASISEPTLTDTFHIVTKYELPIEIKNLKTVTGLATLLSGGGTVAVTQARLDAVDVLSRCGKNEALEDEEPDFMSSPMGWRFEDGEEYHTSWARGTAVGNVVAAALGALILTVIAIIFGLVFKQSWRQGLDDARIPGLLMIPYFVLVPSSSEVAGVLLFNDPSPVARLIAIGTSCVMMGLTMSIVIQLGRLVSSGLVVMRTLPPTPPSKCTQKLEESHWGRKFVRLCLYLFTTSVGWVPHVDVSEYLDVVSGKDDPNKKKQSELATALAVKFGAVFEDFTLPYLPALDAGVSIVLGFCAGVAQGPRIPRTTCIITLSTALLAAAVHFFVFVYYRPCLVRMTQVFMSVASGLTLASVGLSFAFYMGQQFEYNSAVEKIMLSQSLLGVLLMVLGVGFTALVFIDFVDAFLAGKDLKHLEKVTKEQIDQYRKDELQKEQDRQAALLKKSKKNKKTHQQSELEEEFSILVEEMKPLAGEEDLSMLNLKKSKLKTSSNDVNHDSVDQELELVLSPSENQKHNNNHQRELSYHDYLHRSNGSSSSSSSSNNSDEDQDMDSFFQQRRKGSRKTKRRKNAILSQSDRHVIAKNITETSAMIRSVLESEQKQQIQQQDLSRPDPNNKSSTEEKSSVVNTIPQFRNSALTSQQSQRMKELLEQADAKKRKAEEEKIERALKEHEARERAQRHYEEERRRRQEQQQQQHFLDDDEDDDEEAMRELDEILL